MEIFVTITVPFFGFDLTAEVEGTYTNDTFEPEAVWLSQVGSNHLNDWLPTPADVSDFYSAHADAIDEAVRAELADHAEAEADTYEAMRQDEIDDAAEAARA